MQKRTTIIGILGMIEDGYTYVDIRNRYSVGNSVITDLKHKFSDPDLSMEELKSKHPIAIEQRFYGTVIVPAPPMKPVSNGRPGGFRSFVERKTEIRIIIEDLNNRKFHNGKGSREEMFEQYDRPTLKPLPRKSMKIYA